MVATITSMPVTKHTTLATDNLRQENEAILRVLRLMDRAVTYLKDGQKLNPFFFEEIVDFLQLFVVLDHQAKLEEILLPALQKNKLEAAKFSLAIISKAYLEERQLITFMEAGFQRYRVTKQEDRSLLIDTLGQYTHLARRNILMENTLFVLADNQFSTAAQIVLASEFSELEHRKLYAGTPERLKELVNELERQAFHWE